MGGRKFRLDAHRKNEERKKKLKRLNSSGKDTERKKKQCKDTTKNVWGKKKPEQSNPPEKEPDPPEKEPDQSNPQSNPPEEIKNDITLPTITIPIAAFTTGIVQSLS